MKFYEKIVLRLSKEFQELSTEDKRRYLFIFKHAHFATWLTEKFINEKFRILLCFLNIFICLINLGLIHFLKSNVICLLVNILTLSFCFVCMFLLLSVTYKLNNKKSNIIKVQKWLSEKIQNIWLIDGRAISLIDWWHIRKSNLRLYKQLHSEECNSMCYYYSCHLAKTLNNPRIKTIWFCAVDVKNEKYGHAVIEKNGFIYDTNLRRTYPKSKYFAALKAEVFKEFFLEEYKNTDILFQLEWDKFEKWCQEHNAIRNI